MKLAEALIIRADIQKRLLQLASRINNNLIVQEGFTPGEDPAKLMSEYLALQKELKKLVQRINTTNAQTMFDESNTLSDILAERDMLLAEHKFMSDVAEHASQTTDLYSSSEIAKVSTVNVSEIRHHADELAKQYRQLDISLQAKNWTTELL